MTYVMVTVSSELSFDAPLPGPAPVFSCFRIAEKETLVSEYFVDEANEVLVA